MRKLGFIAINAGESEASRLRGGRDALQRLCQLLSPRGKIGVKALNFPVLGNATITEGSYP